MKNSKRHVHQALGPTTDPGEYKLRGRERFGFRNQQYVASGVVAYPLPFGKLSAGRTTKDLINAAYGGAEKLQYSKLVRRS